MKAQALIHSETLTIELVPTRSGSLKLEARYDRADKNVYFAGSIVGDGSATPFLPNARDQLTTTLGATVWW